MYNRFQINFDVKLMYSVFKTNLEYVVLEKVSEKVSQLKQVHSFKKWA